MARRRFQLDETDQALLDCRRENANEPVSELAAKLHLDESSVRRRERRLIDAGVLSYAAIIDYDKVSTYAIEAYVELAFAGNEDVHELLRKVVQDLARPENAKPSRSLAMLMRSCEFGLGTLRTFASSS